MDNLNADGLSELKSILAQLDAEAEAMTGGHTTKLDIRITRNQYGPMSAVVSREWIMFPHEEANE